MSNYTPPRGIPKHEPKQVKSTIPPVAELTALWRAGKLRVPADGMVGSKPGSIALMFAWLAQRREGRHEIR